MRRANLSIPLLGLALALALVGCGPDDEGSGGGGPCDGLDLPLNGRCIADDGGCIEYRGDADSASLATGCELGDGHWADDACAATTRYFGGCHVKSDTVMTPADPEVGAYWTSYHPDLSPATCSAMGGCWVR